MVSLFYQRANFRTKPLATLRKLGHKRGLAGQRGRRRCRALIPSVRGCIWCEAMPLVICSPFPLSLPLSATRQTADRPTLDCAMQRQTCSPAALSIPLRYHDFVILLIIIEHDSGKAVGGQRRQAFLLCPLFIRKDRRKTTKNDTAHAPDRQRGK